MIELTTREDIEAFVQHHYGAWWQKKQAQEVRRTLNQTLKHSTVFVLVIYRESGRTQQGGTH